jgi:adenosylcobinamide-GDP ribazoletransferase
MRRIMDNPALWRDTIRALRFFSRLPLPTLPGEQDAHAPPDLARLMPAVPLAGLVLGGLTGAVLIIAAWLWPPMVAAIICVLAAVIMTGAFHEDGLADTADSIGGHTVEQRLAIMKDSRIGTFGASALILSLGLRVTAIAGLVAAVGAGRTALALAATGAISRTAALILAAHLPPARASGAGHAAGMPTMDGWGRACLTAAALALLAWPAAGIGGVMAAVAVAAGVAVWAQHFAQRHVGGHTGDLAGATQQAVEIAVLLTLLIFA